MSPAEKLGRQLIRLGMWMLFPMLGLHYYLVLTDRLLIASAVYFGPYFLILAVNVRHLTRKEPALRAGKGWMSPLIVFAFLLVLASVRGLPLPYHSIARLGHTTVTFVMVFSFASLYARRVLAVEAASVLVKDLLFGLLILAAFNFGAVFLLGLQAPQAEVLAENIRSRIGLTEMWVFFPFVRNQRDLAQAMGLLALLCLHLRLDHGEKTPGRGVLLGSSALFAVLIIMLTDARMVLVQTALSAAIMVILYKWDLRARVFFLAILGNTLFPLLYFGSLLIFEVDLPSAPDVVLLTGRVYIWAVAAYSALQQDLWTLLTGSGVFSHRSTGLMEIYRPLFLGVWAATDAPTFHNLAIQLLYDIGLIGVVAYLLVLYRSMKALLAVPTPGPLSTQYRSLTLPLVLYIFFSGVGVTESISPLYYSTFFFVLVIFAYYQAVVVDRLAPGPGDGPAVTWMDDRGRV